MNALCRISSVAIVFYSACSCSSVKVKHGLTDGRYDFRQAEGGFKKVDLYVDDNDTVNIKIFDQAKPLTLNVSQPHFLRKSTFDFDALTIPFKFRPGSSQLPRQLDTDFNGNIYLGYRMDRFKLTHHNTPIGQRQKIKQIGFSAGVFGGLGSTFVSPWTTNDPAFTEEYNGFILSRGLAFLVGVNNLTFGVGVGWDYLTDRDKDIWIYQNKPWYGLTVGLNVN